MLRVGLYLGRGAPHYPAAACLIGALDALHAIDISAGGEVGRLDIAHEPGHLDVGIVDIGHAGVYHLAQIVRRHIGRHADGYAAGAVDEEVGDARRHHGGRL